MDDHTFYGRIENGKPILDDPRGFQRLKDSLEGADIEITLRALPKKETVRQHKFYRGKVVKKLAEHTGHTPREVHRAITRRFLTEDRQGRPRIRSTSTLNKSEFHTLIEQAIQLAAEMGCPIDDPIPRIK